MGHGGYVGHVLYGTRFIRGTSYMSHVLGQRFGTSSGTTGTRGTRGTRFIGGVMGAQNIV